jgi:hypothetical protein
MPEQSQSLPASLEFKGRTVLYVHEVAKALGITEQHVGNLVDDGQLAALNLSGIGNKSRRRCLRIPIESYRQFVAKRLQ